MLFLLSGTATGSVAGILTQGSKTLVEQKKGKHECFPLEFGAGNEARTRDLNLGKVALYQLSYSRTPVIADRFANRLNEQSICLFCRSAKLAVYTDFFCLCKHFPILLSA